MSPFKVAMCPSIFPTACWRRAATRARVRRAHGRDQALGLLDQAVGAGGGEDLLHPLQGRTRLGVLFEFEPVEPEASRWPCGAFPRSAFWCS